MSTSESPSLGSFPGLTARILADIRAAEDEDGRLPPVDLSGADIFPFEGLMTPRRVIDPVLPEPPRRGETGPDDCFACEAKEKRAIATGEHWFLTPAPRMSIPAVLLYPVAHCDLEDLPAERLRELGILMARISAAVGSIGEVERVHIYRFGDGAAHCHVWFVARPAGFLQFRGSTLTLWDEALPKRPQEEWDATMRAIAAAFDEAGGFRV